MKEKAVLKSILKKRAAQFVKPFKRVRLGFTSKQFEGARIESNRLREALSIFESYFSPRVRVETDLALQRLSGPLEEARTRNISFLLLKRFVQEEKNSDVRQKTEEILKEVEAVYEKSFQKAAKQLKHIKPKKVAKTLLDDFKPSEDFEFKSLTKQLNQSREKLFNQIVRLIRSSQKEELSELQSQSEKFCYLLELAVEAGYEKGKRLLQIVRVLNERLIEIHDEEKFREFIQNLEKERAISSERVSDIVRLRTIRNRLAVFQAHSLQALHAHLPVSLQFLKRHLVWKEN